MLFSDKTDASTSRLKYAHKMLVWIFQLAMNWQQFLKFNLAAAFNILNIAHCAVFRHNKCVQHRILNIPTKINKNWFSSEEMATIFEIRDGGSRYLGFWLLCHFRHFIRVLHRICSMPTKFGEEW